MKLKCIVSGKEVNVSPKVFADRATKYKVDAEVLKGSYISRESKRLLREGQTVDQIRTATGITGLPSIDAGILEKITAKKISKKAAKTGTEVTDAATTTVAAS